MTPSRIAFTTFLVAIAGCNGAPPPPPGELQRSEALRAAPSDLSSPDVVTVSADSSAFAVALYGQLRPGGANLFYSPWSITSALGMTYAGASGATATQMAGTLHFTLPPERLHAALGTIDETVANDAAHPASGHAIQWRETNALFAQSGKVFLPGFLDVLATHYGAGVSLLDFAATPDASRGSINAWVSDMTDGKILGLLPDGSITGETRFVLTNAAYFHAAWRDAFDEHSTRGAPFHRADGSDVTVQMMYRVTNIGMATGDGWTAVELPYTNEDTRMLVVLPDAGAFDGFETSLDAATLAAVTSALHPTDVGLSLPRFTMRSSFDLVTVLRALGMTDAFEDGLADLSGMDGTRELHISHVVHQAWVDVSESGTEAAAATSVIGTTRGTVHSLPVTIDRPFLLFIRDVPTGAILFAGRVADPTAI